MQVLGFFTALGGALSLVAAGFSLIVFLAESQVGQRVWSEGTIHPLLLTLAAGGFGFLCLWATDSLIFGGSNG